MFCRKTKQVKIEREGNIRKIFLLKKHFAGKQYKN
jgi:hypothetical protein